MVAYWGLWGEQGPEDFRSFDKSPEIGWPVGAYLYLWSEHGPEDCRSFAKEAEIIPLPKDELTPPVTKIYFVLDIPLFKRSKIQKECEYLSISIDKKVIISNLFQRHQGHRVE